MIPDLTVAEVARFYSKMHLGGCGVRWAGPVNNHGYGRFEIYRNGKRVRILAHRLAYRLATGEDPGSDRIRHACDTPPCCTPDCLEPGTQADNVNDAIERGRADLHGLVEHRNRRDAAAQARITAGQKTCSRCKAVKQLNQFDRATVNADGHTYWCKACSSSYQRTSRRRSGAAA